MAKDKNEAAVETPETEQPQEEKLTPSAILDKVLNGEITPEEAKKLNDKRKEKPIDFTIGKKDTYCIKGIRKFPVINLYANEVEKVAEQWAAFLDFVAEEEAKKEAAKEEATQEAA